MGILPHTEYFDIRIYHTRTSYVRTHTHTHTLTHSHTHTHTLTHSLTHSHTHTLTLTFTLTLTLTLTLTRRTYHGLWFTSREAELLEVCVCVVFSTRDVGVYLPRLLCLSKKKRRKRHSSFLWFENDGRKEGRNQPHSVHPHPQPAHVPKHTVKR
jgi:hypothetical protein